MSQKTSIEWVKNTDGTQGHSANPIRFRMKDTGNVVHFCVKVSSGCAHCYSETLGHRWGSPEFVARNLDKVECFLDEKVLHAILRRRKPTTYFLCDMTDWMGEWVPDEFIDRILATVALCPQHTFQLLTKRADRLESYLNDCPDIHGHRSWRAYVELADEFFPDHLPAQPKKPGLPTHRPPGWPLPNLWLGVSCENQQTADERIPDLLQTPAAVRFISAEPLLGPIDLKLGTDRWCCSSCHHVGTRDEEIGFGRCGHCGHELDERDDGGTDWTIIGCESGPRRRPCELDWAQNLVEQCRAAKVPVFVKQLPINGRVSHDPDEWPEDLRVRQMPMPTLEAAR